jgi:hypothetical protein
MEKYTLKLIMFHHNNNNRWVMPTKELNSICHQRLFVVIYALLYAADFSKVLFFCRIIMNLVRFLLEDE